MIPVERAKGRGFLLSVLWRLVGRCLNMARRNYLAPMGEAAGPFLLWPRSGYLRLVSRYFDVLDFRHLLSWGLRMSQPRD
jgi:hypothetical protein